MENQKNNKGVIALLIVIIVILATLFATGIFNFKSNKVNDNDETNKRPFDHITIFYGGGMTFEDQEKSAIYKVDVRDEQLTELQHILDNYDFENENYKIEENGHYHGSKFYSSILVTPTSYKMVFNDGSEMLISDYDYELQYKKGNNYYLIKDGKVIAQKIFTIVDEFIHQEPVSINTENITIKGITSGKSLNINNPDTISKILNEFRYVKDEDVTKDLYERLIKFEKEDYDNGREYPRELEYNVNFNNGTILNIILRNKGIGYITDENNNFIEGIKLNSKFIFIIHNIFTDYYREQNKLLEASEIYFIHNNIEQKIDNKQKNEIINILSMIEIDKGKIKETIEISEEDYILKINNNKIILNKNNLYIIYENGNKNYIRSLDLENYIKNLM